MLPEAVPGWGSPWRAYAREGAKVVFADRNEADGLATACAHYERIDAIPFGQLCKRLFGEDNALKTGIDVKAFVAQKAD